MRGWARFSTVFVIAALSIPQAMAQIDATDEQDIRYEKAYEQLGLASETDADLTIIKDEDVREGLSILEELSDEEYGPASLLLGTIYSQPFYESIDVDFAKSRFYSKRAIKTNDPEIRPFGCANLANAWAHQDSLSSDDWLKIRELTACARVNPELHGLTAKPLAFSYLFADDVHDKIGDVLPLLEQVVTSNPDDGHSAYLLGKGLKDGWFGDEDWDRGCSYLLQAAELEDDRAYWHIGMCHLSGTGVEKSEKLALNWVLASAEAGHTDGLISAGVMYALGQGTEISPLRAAELYEQAILAAAPGTATQGHAMRSLGAMHAFGEIENNDVLFGYTLLTLAEEFGDDQAPLLLSNFDDLNEEQVALVAAEKAKLRQHYNLPAE